jgi:hypothetical protein
MRYLVLLSLAPVFSFCLLADGQQRQQRQQRTPLCLPPGVRMTDMVLAEQTGEAGGSGQPVQVRQKLSALKARCRRGRLVDAVGKTIRFYRRTDCWGNPPFDAAERTRQQDGEIRELGKRYAVIVLACRDFSMTTP